MPRLYKKKNKRVRYDLETMRNAIAAVRRGNTLREVSERFGVPKSTLRKYRNVGNISDIHVGAGRKTFLKQEDEKALAKYLFESGKFGYGLTKWEILKFVKEFCEYTGNIWNEAGPGREWFEGFMRRHPEISLREGESISSQRLRGADPFVIKQWYQSLDRIYQTERILATDGHLVYNCDETGFGHDPEDVLLVAPKGQKRVSKNIAGSGKKNTTRQICVAKLDTRRKLPTMYTAQHKGWMEGGLFFKWFKESFLPFIKSTEERGGKKVILIFDGASVHTSYPLSKCAIDNGVILSKLPENVSHYMQPLDKCVFKPIKTMWNKEMVDFNRTFPARILPNEDFSKRIKNVWEDAFKSEYLISGFRSTGLFPLSFNKFLDDGYDPIKLKRFKSSTDIENVPNQQEQVKNQNPEPPAFEDFKN
ncbi:hypothetical protein JTB14_002584 [Gonioctena quinquepunctata]|nr:hypothetical protein JTB14_002584 [Gonioctena quinquepunctata]